MPLSTFLLDQAQRHAAPAAVLTAFVISIAYVRAPRAKALIYSLPVPFSCAYLATGLPINATHISGLILVAGYNWLVYLLTRAKVPLLAAIVLSAAAYFAAAMALRPLAAISLWWLAAAALAGWLVALAAYRPRDQPAHRSRTAWYVKAPLIFALAVAVFNATGLLAGGVGLFPYAGIFASYESRHSLRTLAGQFTLNAVGLLLCLLTIHAAEGRLPAPLPLLLGWLPVLAWAAFVHAIKLGKAPENTEAL
jgi:hypothetical protein